MKKTLVYLSLLMTVSCLNRTVEQECTAGYDRNQFFEINYEEILNQPTVVDLSTIAESVEYVRLETNDNCLLRTTAEYSFTNEYIFVRNVDHVLMFDRKGNFIRKIGKPGRGPGEIGIIRYLSVIDSASLLVVQTNWARKLYYFNYDGDFLRSSKVPDVLNIRVLPDHRQLLYSPPNWGKEKEVFALIDLNGDTLSVVNNHYNWENRSGYGTSVSYNLFTPFYEYDGIISMKYMYNDTIYHLLGDSIIPEYVVNMGRYSLPDEYRVEVLQGGFELFKEKSVGYRFAVPFEAAEKIFIPSEPFSDLGENTQWNMIYDRRSSSGNLLVDASGEPGKIINDIDGGPDFWPLKAVNDSIVVMSILPHTLLGDKNLKYFNEKAANDPGKKSEFLDNLSKMGENDNPLLMIVKLKK